MTDCTPALPRTEPIHVLFIEDDKYYFAYVRQLLSRQKGLSFQIKHVLNLAEATAQLRQEIPDVILLDLHLPDGVGLDNLRRVKLLSNGAPIVILTGCDDAKTGLESVSCGAQDYLVKSHIGQDALVRCLRYAIERRKSEESFLRFSAIADFSTTLAHDLQVPMIGTRNVLAALLSAQYGDLNSELQQVLLQLSTNNDKQLMLVEKLLEIYRYEVGVKSFPKLDLDLCSLLASCVAVLSDPTDAQTRIDMDLPPELPSLSGNAEALNKLFISLLDNAIKYSDGTEPVKVGATSDGGMVRISIHNSGAEIPSEVQDNLFRRFWHGVPGKQYVPHTGLSLYLSQRIAGLHNGRIACYSSSENGTTMTVSLPVTSS